MDHTKFVTLAQRLIAANGRDIVLQRLSSVAANAAQPWKGPGTPTVASSYERKGTFLPHTGLEDLGKFLVEDSLLKRSQEVVMVAGGDDDLTVCNQMIDSSKTWKIDWIRELKPGTVTVLYAMGVSQ